MVNLSLSLRWGSGGASTVQSTHWSRSILRRRRVDPDRGAEVCLFHGTFSCTLLCIYWLLVWYWRSILYPLLFEPERQTPTGENTTDNQIGWTVATDDGGESTWSHVIIKCEQIQDTLTVCLWFSFLQEPPTMILNVLLSPRMFFQWRQQSKLQVWSMGGFHHCINHVEKNVHMFINR